MLLKNHMNIQNTEKRPCDIKNYSRNEKLNSGLGDMPESKAKI